MEAAQYWHAVDSTLSLLIIILTAIVTFLALIEDVPSLVVAGVAGFSTIWTQLYIK